MKSLGISLVLALAVSQAGAYPKPYAADVSTPELKAALTERLWAHDPSTDVRLWPTDRLPAGADEKPYVFTEKELGLTSYQLRSIRPFSRYPDKKLEKAIETINDAFKRLNSNPMQKESYITALSQLSDIFS